MIDKNGFFTQKEEVRSSNTSGENRERDVNLTQVCEISNLCRYSSEKVEVEPEIQKFCEGERLESSPGRNVNTKCDCLNTYLNCSDFRSLLVSHPRDKIDQDSKQLECGVRVASQKTSTQRPIFLTEVG